MSDDKKAAEQMRRNNERIHEEVARIRRDLEYRIKVQSGKASGVIKTRESALEQAEMKAG